MTHEMRSYFGSMWVTMSPGGRWKTTNLYPIEVCASKRARLPGRGKAAGSRETMRNDAMNREWVFGRGIWGLTCGNDL